MAAVGLLDQNDAVRYFATFPQLLDQTVKRRVLMRPLNFQRLLELMVAAKEEDFVIVSHGNPDGLVLKLTGQTRMTADESAVKILLNAEATRRDVATAGEDLRRWRRVLDRLEIELPAGWRDLDAAKVRELRRTIEQWQNRAARALGLRRPSFDHLVGLVEQLHARKVGKVDFRGCNLGKKEEVLATFRRFFGAAQIRAPRVRSFFGEVPLGTHLSAAAIRKTGRRRGGVVYGEAPSRVAVAIRYVGHNARLWGAAESKAAVLDWVHTHIGPLNRFRARVPLHWLQTDPPAFPRDDEYRLNLRTLTAP